MYVKVGWNAETAFLPFEIRFEKVLMIVIQFTDSHVVDVMSRVVRGLMKAIYDSRSGSEWRRELPLSVYRGYLENVLDAL